MISNDFIKWLDLQEPNKWFTVYEICRAVKQNPNTASYRKFNRMVAYGILEFKYDMKRHALIYRRKKE